MSNSKNYNSIVFLTTLSVYLGLVLVGATPSVLAQTNLTEKNFQISSSSNPYGNAIYELVKELEELSKKKKYDWTDKFDLNYQFSFFEANKPPAFGVSGKLPDDIVSKLFNKTAIDISRNLSQLEDSFSNQDDKYLSPFNISFSLDSSNLIIEANRSVVNGFSNSLLNLFKQESISLRNQSLSKIYENTKIISENNQVFIVTRLPRASIDELLAEKDAK